MLKNASSLTGGSYRGGIEVGEGARVGIAGNGILNVKGGEYGAGIGGGNGMTAGAVEIANYYDINKNHTRIYALGGSSAAGIGGGKDGGGGNVTVNGGYVNVTGSGDAQDIGRGAATDGKSLSVGTTTANGGRLVNCQKVDWSPEDTGERREVKLQVYASSNEPEHQNIRIQLSKPHEQYLNVIDVPNAQGLLESDVSYLYIPKSKRVITVTVDAKGYKKMDEYMYGVGKDEPVKIYLDLEEDKKE
jgi:hypothetical protein